MPRSCAYSHRDSWFQKRVTMFAEFSLKGSRWPDLVFHHEVARLAHILIRALCIMLGPLKKFLNGVMSEFFLFQLFQFFWVHVISNSTIFKKLRIFIQGYALMDSEHVTETPVSHSGSIAQRA